MHDNQWRHGYEKSWMWLGKIFNINRSNDSNPYFRWSESEITVQYARAFLGNVKYKDLSAISFNLALQCALTHVPTHTSPHQAGQMLGIGALNLSYFPTKNKKSLVLLFFMRKWQSLSPILPSQFLNICTNLRIQHTLQN